MGTSAQLAVTLIFILSVLIGNSAGQIVPYGVRSKCYKVIPKAAKVANSFCTGEVPTEVFVCARNIDDANSRVLAAETEIRALNAAYCKRQSEDFCKSLGMSAGICPATGLRCKMPFHNECTEDADCKSPVFVCCATCEMETAAFQCEGMTPKLIDALCQVGFCNSSYFDICALNPLLESQTLQNSQTLRWRCHFSARCGCVDLHFVDCSYPNELKHSKRAIPFMNLQSTVGSVRTQLCKTKVCVTLKTTKSLGIQWFLKATIGRILKAFEPPLLLHFVRFAHGATSVSDGSDLNAVVSLGVHIPLRREACLQ